MDSDRLPQLAERLAQILPTLELHRPRQQLSGMHVPESDPEGLSPLLVEARRLVHGSPALRRALLGAGREEDRAGLPALVLQALSSGDGHRAAVLEALLGGVQEEAGTLSGGDDDGRFRKLRTRLLANGWLARSVASAWMNVLVLVTAAAAFLTLWGGLGHRADGAEIAVGLLKVFTLWCLAFLPGWLYIRFLGQRAGALWSEFVIHLHRLGWDGAGYLPRPPRSTPFFDEWVRAGGPLHSERQNLYRQKFDAYYGKAVVEGAQKTNFAVRIDTMFPVFLATAVLSVCWITVLWDPGFVIRPSSVWDVLRFGFLGAYAFVVQNLIRRFFQSDLRPSAYAAAVLRVVVVGLFITALHQVMVVGDRRVEAVTAFVVGFFPLIALQALERVAATALPGPQLADADARR